jgi:hypothetical protein
MSENKNKPQNQKSENQKVDPEKKYEIEKENMDIKSADELAKEAEVTSEDMEALGPKGLSMDMQDDERLKQRANKVDFEGKDLDIPGRGMDDDQENIGAEDEENNHYSLGSDENDQLDQGI